MQAVLVDERAAQLRRSYPRESSELSELAAHAQQLSNGSVNIGCMPAVGLVPEAPGPADAPASESTQPLLLGQRT